MIDQAMLTPVISSAQETRLPTARRHNDPAAILLVDGDQANLQALEEVLTPLGLNVVKASSGKEALTHALETDFALIVVDACVPDIDSVLLSGGEKAHEKLHYTPIIFIAPADSAEREAARAYAAGVVDVVVRPFNSQIVRSKVQVFVKLFLERETHRLKRAELTDRHRRELLEKNRELARAVRTKDRFLATISHELRTPLNAIIGFTGILLMRLSGPLTAKQEKQLSSIETSARHLHELINDLLDLSKIESGKVQLKVEAVDSRDLMAEIAETLRPLAEKKGLDFKLTFTDHQLPVSTDERLVKQILMNLLSNAIKYTQSGFVRFEIGQRNEGGRSLVEFNVIDSGMGIRPEDHSKLFRAFERSGDAFKAEGTGLGLYLSKRLSELLDGNIEVESEYQKGSRFTLVIPQQITGDHNGSDNPGR